MKLYYFIIKIFLLLILLSSCSKDWFNIKSDQNISVPSTVKDVEYLLDNYSAITANTPALGELASDGHNVSEDVWEIFQQDNSSYGWLLTNAYTWTKNAPYREVNDWKNAFRRIAYCNTVLDRLNYIQPSSNELMRYNYVKGNAIFHRARTYFDLSQIFAEPYIRDTDSQFGLPLKTDVSVITVPQRSTVHKTYDFIVKDLETASELLPALPEMRSRGSKISCYALLAKIKLIMGDYQAAIQCVNKVFDINSKLMNYSLIPLSSPNLGVNNDEIIFYSHMINYDFNASPYAKIDSSFYKLYNDNDLRKKLFFQSAASGITFKGNYSELGYITSCLATDEMYLIRAECLARTNSISAAMNDLNVLLRSRWAKNSDGTTKYLDQVATSETQALVIILQERTKELMFRGIRWTDLRRLNLDNRFRTELVRKIGGQTYKLEPNSYRYTFPIPDDEISLLGITQNPGWEK